MSELNEKARQSAKKAVATLGDDALYAITLVAPHLRKGVFWGFTTPKDLDIEALKGSGNIRALQISDAIIVEINPSYIVKAVQSIDPNLLKQQDVALMEQNMGEASAECTKYLLNLGIKTPGATQIIAIYSTNDVTTIAMKGNRYPAFRLNIEKAFELMARLGYEVEVNGSFIPAVKAAGMQNVLQSMKLSPTKTGIFMKIRSTADSKQLKEIKKQLTGRR